MVIFYTSYGIAGSLDEPLSRLTNGVFNTGNLGVAIFFIISGYLITMSWDKRRDVMRFVWARFLRLVPALVGVALITVFIIGPIVTHQSLRDYFSDGLTWGYFTIVTVFFPAYQLPGVFTDNPITRVNGALWTLPVEATMYLVILAAGVLGVLNKKRLATFITLSALGIFLYLNIHTIHVIIPTASHDLIDALKNYLNSISLFYPLFFLMGSVFYLNNDRLKFDLRIVLAAFVVWVLSFPHSELLLLTSFVCLPYVVLGLAYASIPYLNSIGKKADISYGLYIYHYPVQQTLINFFKLDPVSLFIMALVITVPLSWLSWHLIESRALSLKNIELKIFGQLSVIYMGAIKTLHSYFNSIGGLLKGRPSRTTSKGMGIHLAYLYELRVAIIAVIATYTIFAVLGYTMGQSYQSAMPVTTDPSVSCASSIGNLMSLNTAISIFVNSILNCIIAIASGIFLGILPLTSIMTNGMALGWYTSIILPRTCMAYIMASSIPYGLFEMPAVWLSSAIGLKLGYSLIRSLTGKKGLVQEIRKGARAFIYLILPFIAITTVLNTFISLPMLSLIINWIC